MLPSQLTAVIMRLNVMQSAFILLVNMAAIYGQVKELAYLVATIGSLQNCDIQVIMRFLQVYMWQLIVCLIFSRNPKRRAKTRLLTPENWRGGVTGHEKFNGEVRIGS